MLSCSSLSTQNETAGSLKTQYASVASPTTNENQYFNAKTGRTYAPLKQHYKPKDFFAGKGYYSPDYGQIYFDGYGFNFYTGEYGFYEWSLNLMEQPPLEKRHVKFTANTAATILFIVFVLSIIVCTCIWC